MNAPDVVRLGPSMPEDLLAEWSTFVVGQRGSFFQSPLWLTAWWDRLAGRPPTEIGFWRRNGQLEAVASRSRVSERLHPRVPIPLPFTTNGGSGVGAADHSGWLATELLLPEVRRWFGAPSPLRPILLQSISRTGVDTGGRVVRSRRCPQLDIAAYIAGSVGSSKLKKQVRYNRRRLADSGVQLEWRPPGTIDFRLLESLIELHRDRRAMVADTTVFDHTRLPLHLDLAQGSTALIGTAAVVAVQEATPVAILYGLVCGKTFSYFQSGWNPTLAAMSIGSLLVDEAVRQAASAGCETFDFLRGPEPYKYRFGAEDVINDDVLIGRGPIASALKLKRTGQAEREQASEAAP